ncbi:MAG: PEP/pyruvate-binding domain-containing protein [Bacteroidia bacterium]
MLALTGFRHNASVQGGKAAGLARLKAAGYRVPAYQVLDARVFKSFLGPDFELRPGWEKQGAVQKLLEETDAQKTYAVRSSAVGEDGKLHAYPGMLDSKLDVSPASLLAAIKQVAESVGNARLQAYRSEKKIHEPIYPAVIVQEWIKADFSGVMFTTYPAYPNELLIHVVSGSGEGLVNGSREASEYAFDKGSGKDYWQHCLPLEEQPDFAMLEALFRVGQSLERQFGGPQDVEFCISGEQLYLLQMRPVTTAVAQQLVLDNANIQESYCGATTELTYSFARKAYASVYTQTMRALGLPESKIRQQQNVVQNLLYRHQGRIYYNINNWYKGLQLLPSFRQNKADMERMMGLESPVAFIHDRKKSWWELLQGLPTLILNLLRLLLAFRKLERSSLQFQADFKQVFDGFYADTPGAFNLEQCRIWYQKINAELLYRWDLPIVNDFYVMMQNGKLHRELKAAAIHQPEQWLQSELHAGHDLPSLAPMNALIQLAKKARADKRLEGLLLQNPPELLRLVASNFPDFYAEVMGFIHQFGDRTIGELKMETISMRVDPKLFFIYLRPFLKDEPIQTPKSSAEGKKIEVKSLAGLKKGIWRREALRLERTRLFGMYRCLFRRTAELLVEEGILHSPDEVFQLRLEELESYWSGGALPPREEIDRRSVALAQWLTENPPGRVYLPGRQVAQASGELQPGFWQGQAAVSGIVQGEVVCITELAEVRNLDGKILCALRTDPGWAPLFRGCKGVIIEKGSALSHSVILLRELGIPTVINVPGIHAGLQNGMQLQIDGNEGQVKVL